MRKTGISTLRLFCEIMGGLREAPGFLENLSNYAVDGGCVPLRTNSGSIFGYMIASGNDHQYDHEVAVLAIAAFLKVGIPSLIRLKNNDITRLRVLNSTRSPHISQLRMI